MHSNHSPQNSNYITQQPVSHPYPQTQPQINNNHINRGPLRTNNQSPNQSYYTASPSFSTPKYFQPNTTYHSPPSPNAQYARYRSPTAPNPSPDAYPNRSNPNSHYNHATANQFRRSNKMNKPQHVQQQNSISRNRTQSARRTELYSDAQQHANMNSMYRVTSAESNHSLHSAFSAQSTHSQPTTQVDSMPFNRPSSSASISLHREKAETDRSRSRTLSTHQKNKRRSANNNNTNALQPLRLTNTTSGPPLHQYNPSGNGTHNTNNAPPIRLTNALSGPQSYTAPNNNNTRMRLTNVASGPPIQSYNAQSNQVRVFSPKHNNDMKLPNNIGITEYKESDYMQREDPYYQKPKPQLRRAETEPTSAPPPPNRAYPQMNRSSVNPTANYGYMRSVNENMEIQQPQMQYGFAQATAYNNGSNVMYSNAVQVHQVQPVYNTSPYPQGMMYNTMVYNQYQAYNPNHTTTTGNNHTATHNTQEEEEEEESESESGGSGDSSDSRSSDYSGSTSRSWSESSSSRSTSYSEYSDSKHSKSQHTVSRSDESKETLPQEQDATTLPRQDSTHSMVSTSTMGTMVFKDDKTKRQSRRWSDIDPEDYKTQQNVMTPLSPIADGVGFGDLATYSGGHMDIINTKEQNEQIDAGAENEGKPSHLLLISSKMYEKSEESAELLRHVLNSKRQKALFAGLDDRMMAKMVDRMYRVECRKNECIIKQNEKGDAYFVVESGKFSIIRNETVVGFMSTKSAFGEASLLYATPRSATLKAKQNSVVWALDASEFMKIRAKLSKKKIKKSRKKVKFLQKLALFDGFDDSDLMDIAAAMKAILYKKGEHLITLSETNNHFFIVYRGVCQSEGICEYRECDYFGEDGCMEPDTLSSIQVTAISDEAICYVLNATEFMKFLHPKYFASKIRYNPPDLDYPFANLLGDHLQLSQFHFIGVIGVGRFGEISLVQHPNGFETYALKKIRKNRIVDSHSERHMRCERGIISALDCDFCVKLYATFQDELNVYLLQEAVLGGELFDLLNFNKRFPEKTARFYAACVILAFQHLHEKNVIFRHLKPQNLLVSENGYLKVCDFGFAKIRNDSCTLCGTPEYLPPEVIQCAHQSFSTDWWTLGVFIYQMIVGVVPFQDDPNLKMYDKILSSPVVFPSKENIKISQSGKDLIAQLLRKHPYKRLGSGFDGVENIKKQAWFETDFNWTQMEKQKIVPPYLPTIANNKDISNFNTFKPQNVVETLIPDKTGKLFAWCDQF